MLDGILGFSKSLQPRHLIDEYNPSIGLSEFLGLELSYLIFNKAYIGLQKKYFSCFSGIGGLEGSQVAAGYCEIDPAARKVLSTRFPDAPLYSDIRQVTSVDADVVVGGWPCQDISIAGKGRGLQGANSGLFYELLRLARNSGATTVVAENVSNVLRLDDGHVFREILSEFSKSGFANISWRMLNARQFGLPHHRNRVFFIASKDPDIPLSIFRKPSVAQVTGSLEPVAGFYWTAGTHSINYSKGYVPTIKVGSSLSIPSPPAIHYRDHVRLLSPHEALTLQGFDDIDVSLIKSGNAYRFAGNAVAAPVGRFVVDGVLQKQLPDALRVSSQLSLLRGSFLEESGSVPATGLFDGELTEVEVDELDLAGNLAHFIDFESNAELSTRAASGLLARLDRSNTFCPPELRAVLTLLSSQD